MEILLKPQTNQLKKFFIINLILNFDAVLKTIRNQKDAGLEILPEEEDKEIYIHASAIIQRIQ